jgi:hypothetical protein
MQSQCSTLKWPLTIVLAAAVIALFAAVQSTVSVADASSTSAAAPADGTTVIAISCGGKAASPYIADTDFSGGAVSGGTTHAITTTSVTDPAPQEVYQHGRVADFTYTIPSLTVGTAYTVRLHFCEYYWDAAGKRTFNVKINGTQVLTDFDIFKTAGGEYIANVQQFSADPNSSGQIVIQFSTIVNNAIVDGIQIETSASSSSSSSSSAATSSSSSTSTAATSISNSSEAAGSSGTEVSTSTSTTGGTIAPASSPTLFLNEPTIEDPGGQVGLAPAGANYNGWGVASGNPGVIFLDATPYCLQSFNNTSGSTTLVWTCDDDVLEEFTAVPVSNKTGYYYFQQAGQIGTLCLDATGTTSGSAVDVDFCNLSTEQQWLPSSGTGL